MVRSWAGRLINVVGQEDPRGSDNSETAISVPLVAECVVRKRIARQWGSWISEGPAFNEGGQGRLYTVRDETGAQQGNFVLKELKNPNRAERFQAELDAILKLAAHPNVIELIDFGIYRDPAKPCYVMPMADATLDWFVHQNGLEIPRLLDVFEGICRGVAHLHSASIVHRDIKPENILMFGATPKVSDFGLSLLVGRIRETKTSEAVGPRFYMAPELEEGFCIDVGPEADVYSLGKVLYFMLSRGGIFSREKYRSREYSLVRLLSDDRMRIFDAVFDRSVTADRYGRSKNASDFLSLFENAKDKFNEHPRSRLISTFGSLRSAVFAEDVAHLDQAQWRELLEYVEQAGELDAPEGFWAAAMQSVGKDSSDAFVRCLKAKESQLSEEFLIDAAARIVGLPDLSIWLTLGGRDDLSWVYQLALRSKDIDTCAAVARQSMLTLRRDPCVIGLIGQRFESLPADARQSFLIASCRVEYSGKEDLLLSYLEGNDTTDLELEAVVAGLCECGTPRALNRVRMIAENATDSTRGESIMRGIVFGSNRVTGEALAKFQWSNPIIPILLNAITRPKDDTESEE